MTTNTNGQVRKTLASQIDRLDSMLDGLAEGINDTVVTAVKEAVNQVVREAVQAVITELLTNPDLQQRLHPACATPNREPPLPRASQARDEARRVWNCVTSGLQRVWSRTVTVVGTVWSRTATAVRQGSATARRQGSRAVGRMRAMLLGARLRTLGLWHLALRLRKPVLFALGVGLTIGVSCYLAGPTVASVVSGLHSAALALVAAAAQPVRRVLSEVRANRAS